MMTPWRAVVALLALDIALTIVAFGTRGAARDVLAGLAIGTGVGVVFLAAVRVWNVRRGEDEP